MVYEMFKSLSKFPLCDPEIAHPDLNKYESRIPKDASYQFWLKPANVFLEEDV